ncbi:diguanylate cyclase [Sulfurimonas sp. SWIR-19]|uniref:sensor domain-containing diguanylate cyclase n=1 Tax=Sulfurimonas sp. SWIR-19 TaxID=2878390 RepID=UPI001CF2E7DB|nr:diguanylate cyclase [Sulfurimonas sp. SWIR-19]UCN00773.1 diguanylate cyclase [Sulfurimonas sp. SWIR-19]
MQNVNASVTIAIDELPDNVVIYKFQDGDFVFVDINKNVEKTENISKKELIGKKLTEAFPGVKDFGLFDLLLQVYQDGKPRELDTRLYKDEKTNGWRYNSVRKLSNGELIVFYKDMTRCKQLEDEVYSLDKETAQERRKVHLLAKALQQTDDMVLITDANGIIEYVNDSVLVKTGYDRSELIGNKTNIFKSGKHTDEFYKRLWKTILSGKNYNSVIIDKTKGGRLYYADLKITPLFDEEKNIQNFVATSTDITSRIEMEKKLKKLATTDSLTEIYNRYKIDEAINLHIERYKRYREPFCILMFDIDFFKKVNDTYGHDVGDRVLKALSRLVLTHIRKTDIFGRWGGEEFVIILENTSREKAVHIAEKLRKRVEAYSIDKKYKITISIGVTEYSEPETREELVKKADEALYKAKQNGRNQVVVA